MRSFDHLTTSDPQAMKEPGLPFGRAMQPVADGYCGCHDSGTWTLASPSEFTHSKVTTSALRSYPPR